MYETTTINNEMLIENADFLKAVVGAETIEEAQQVCAEYHMELPEEVWAEIQKSFRNGELGEDDLDVVNGGKKISGNHLLSALGGVVGLGATIAAGSAAGVVVACAWIGYHGYKTFW